VLFTIGAQCYADKLIFKNGEKLKGNILFEDENEITLDVGTGHITFSHDVIARIKRDDKKSSVPSIAPEEPLVVPVVDASLEVLFSEFRALKQLRWRAIQTQTERDRLYAEYVAHAAQYSALLGALKTINENMDERHAVGDLKSYEQFLSKKEIYFAQKVKLKKDALRLLEEKGWRENELFNLVATLFNAYIQFEQTFKAFSKKEKIEEERYYVGKLSEEFNFMREDFIRKEIKYTDGEKGPLIDIILNRKIKTKLRLDLTSPLIIISTKLSQVLTLYDPFGEQDFQIGQEAVAQGAPKILMSIIAGDFNARHMNVIVGEDFPDADVSGVLGIPFLAHCAIAFDQTEKKINVYEFEPQKSISQES